MFDELTPADLNSSILTVGLTSLNASAKSNHFRLRRSYSALEIFGFCITNMPVN